MSQEELSEYFRQYKLKITPVRIAVLSMLVSAQAPISVSELLGKIEANKTTIYRVIDKLVEVGIATEVIIGDGTGRYELATNSHHHHLICTECKGVTSFDIQDNFTEIEKNIAKSQNFKVNKHRLEFLGTCKNCS